MSRQPRQRWQPISMLPTLASLIDGMLETSQEQHQDFLQTRSRPHVFDEALVNRAIRVYTEQMGDLRFYERQLKRWSREELTGEQQAEVERVTAQR